MDALRERVDDTAKYVGTKIDVADVVKRISGMLTMEVFEPFVRKLTDEQLFAQLRSDAGGELLFLSNAFWDRVLLWIREQDTQALDRFRRALSTTASIRRGRPKHGDAIRRRRQETRPACERAVAAFCREYRPLERATVMSELVDRIADEFKLLKVPRSERDALARSLRMDVTPSRLTKMLNKFVTDHRP